jgi:serine phosphatase RsbU (regulator of sigma subunit)
MFPTRPLDAPGWDVAGAWLPSREVGGDFHDWHRTPTGPVVTVGDVMGKGMPGCSRGCPPAARSRSSTPDMGTRRSSADGRVEPRTVGGLPLGISISEEYRSVRVALETGDLLLRHSDGLIELPGGPATAQAAALIAGFTSAAEAAVCDGHALPGDVTVVAVAHRLKSQAATASRGVPAPGASKPS